MLTIENEFSRQGDLHKAARPLWPATFLRSIAELCVSRELAWDCATGNGQVAVGLAPLFKSVVATDISADQIQRAIPASNVTYEVGPAERSHLKDQTVNLITGGHAPQWLNLDQFYEEVRRVASRGAVIALFGFREATVTPEIDALTTKLIQDIIGPFWYSRGKALDDSKFQSLYFPFQECGLPPHAIRLNCSAEQLLALYDSYSGAQRYKDTNGQNASAIIRNDFIKAWGGENICREFHLPVYHRIGIV